MLTRLKIRNFKLFEEAEIELGPSVVLVGPNNSGKTSALQALALWEVGVRRWQEKRSNGPKGEQRIGAAINRKDLISVPVRQADLLWRNLRVRKGARVDGKQKTQNILIEVIVEGVQRGQAWSCGIEFDYSNEESLYCRPLRLADGKSPERMAVPLEAAGVRVAYLPPMSGLASEEPKWEPGRINVLIGEGQTAQVLRNLCHQLLERSPRHPEWEELVELMKRMFGVELQAPEFVPERGEVRMSYRQRGVTLDLSSAGRGLQQVLLLASYILANPGSVLLLDEPDAHLEVLRQREVYRKISDLAGSRGCQIIAATHSEVVLDEAADKDIVVAFVGRPHRIDDRAKTQVIKALRDVGYDQYELAELRGWVLYLEGSTDLEILHVFARKLLHPAAEFLERPFFKAVETNLPQKAREHFYALREAKPDLFGVALFDRLNKELHQDAPLVELAWRRREIENYLCTENVLLRYARHDLPDDLFGLQEGDQREEAMKRAIAKVREALLTLRRPDPFGPDCKSSDDFLAPVFEEFFRSLGFENFMRKTDYHRLAELVLPSEIDPEVAEKLDVIARVAGAAHPAPDG